MAILTIYNHGTGGASTKETSKKEIVNLFGNGAKGREGIDYMITEGVGKKGSPEKSLMVESIHGGNYANIMHKVETTPSKNRVRDNLNAAVGNSGFKSRVVKKLGNDKVLQASGIGVDENVVSMLNAITALVRVGEKPQAINMMGWSRGAVTCIRIAYFLYLNPDLRDIPVNIFAVDPVAGQGHNNEVDAYTINSNVKNYIATLAVNEDRGGFAPIGMQRLNFLSDETQRAILPLPGIHSDTAKFSSSSGILTFNLCARFLEYHGTDLHNGLKAAYRLDDMKALKEYDKLLQGNKASKVKAGQGWFAKKTQGGAVKRTISTNFDVKSQFFINAHHKVLFRTLFRVTYEKFFGMYAMQKNTSGWENIQRRSTFEELNRMPPAHKTLLMDLLESQPMPWPNYLGDQYSYAVVNNELYGH